MYIYNVTTYVHWSIHAAWLVWMREVHIPAILGTECFESYQLVKLLETDETDGPTYAVQYFSAAKEAYQRFVANHEASFFEANRSKWGEQCLSFRSVMEVVK